MGLLWTAVSVRDHPKTSAVAPLQPERAKRMCTRKRTEKTPERACAANVHKVLAQLDVQPHQQRESNDPSPRRAPLSVARDFLFRFAHFWTTARAGSTSLRAPIVVVSNTATSTALVSSAHTRGFGFVPCEHALLAAPIDALHSRCNGRAHVNVGPP